jgi:hypothetical protein
MKIHISFQNLKISVVDPDPVPKLLAGSKYGYKNIKTFFIKKKFIKKLISRHNIQPNSLIRGEYKANEYVKNIILTVGVPVCKILQPMGSKREEMSQTLLTIRRKIKLLSLCLF